MADIDLSELRKQCITSLYLCTDNVSKYMDSEKVVKFEKLKSYTEKYCLLEAQQDVAIQALEKAKSETDSSNLKSLQDRFEEHMRMMAGRRLNVNKHPYIIEFNKRVSRGMDNAARNLDESDLAITEPQSQTFVDPITKRPIEDPVKNTVCGHVYERQSILDLIGMKPRTKCPVAGCGNRGPILADHLVSDEELRFRMTISQHSTMIQERSVLDLDCSYN